VLKVHKATTDLPALREYRVLKVFKVMLVLLVLKEMQALPDLQAHKVLLVTRAQLDLLAQLVSTAIVI
jgi:hypothetical protein